MRSPKVLALFATVVISKFNMDRPLVVKQARLWSAVMHHRFPLPRSRFSSFSIAEVQVVWKESGLAARESDDASSHSRDRLITGWLPHTGTGLY